MFKSPTGRIANETDVLTDFTSDYSAATDHYGPTDTVRALAVDPLASALRTRFGIEDASVPVYLTEEVTEWGSDSTVELATSLLIEAGPHSLEIEEYSFPLVHLLRFLDGAAPVGTYFAYRGPGIPQVADRS